MRNQETLFLVMYILVADKKKGRLNFQEQLETHTERQFLNDAKEIVLPGNHLKMSGTLNPCKPGCQPAIRRFVLNNNVTAEYSANNKKFEWYKSGDGKVIQNKKMELNMNIPTIQMETNR